MKDKKLVLLIFVELFAIIGLVVCLVAGRMIPDKKDNIEVHIVTLQEQLNDMEFLVTMSYDYTSVAKYENYNDFYGWKVPFTTSKFIASFDGRITAGIDLTNVDISINEEYGIVQLTIPQPEIFSNEIFFDSFEVFDESTSIFNPIKITQMNDFYSDQADLMEKKAIDKGVLVEAREKAEEYLESFIMVSIPEVSSVYFFYK